MTKSPGNNRGSVDIIYYLGYIMSLFYSILRKLHTFDKHVVILLIIYNIMHHHEIQTSDKFVFCHVDVFWRRFAAVFYTVIYKYDNDKDYRKER